MQNIKVGDVVLIHDDGPHVQWKLTLTEKLSEGGDGLIHAADVRTSSGKTNQLIAKLYPLEMTDDSTTATKNRATEEQDDTCTHDDRPPRHAAATRQIIEWAKVLPPPRRMSRTRTYIIHRSRV